MNDEEKKEQRKSERDAAYEAVQRFGSAAKEHYAAYSSVSDKEKKGQGKNSLRDAAISGAAYETVQRYGSAVKEHFVAYSGVDNEAGKTLTKGLKQISQEKVNPDYKYQNIHQQAGFSAEVKSTAKDNAEKIINGDPTRKVRTDDIGRVNDPMYDTVVVDAQGNVIEGSETQIKFVGASESDPTGQGDAARALKKFQSKKYDKYFDNDTKIEVPSDQYDKIIQEADKEIEALSKQLERAKESGNTEQTEQLQKKLERLNKIKKNTRKSSVSSKEAVFAREHPGLSTAADVAKLSHRAGVQMAGTSALIGGSFAMINSLVAVAKGEIEPEDAVRDVAKATAEAGAGGYATGFAGTAIKGAMQNSSSETLRVVANKTNAPAAIAMTAVRASQTLARYFSGEIDGLTCLETLGEEGAGMVSSSMFTVIGQAVIPVPVVGGMIGGMVGYAFSSAAYGVLVSSLKEERLAHEHRLQVEQACEEYARMIRQYREEMETLINTYLSDTMDCFRASFAGIQDALDTGDADQFIQGADAITQAFGGEVKFSNVEEFKDLMLSDEIFVF